MEKDRIIEEYKARESRVDHGLYSMLRPANALAVHRLERALLRGLHRSGVRDLAPLKFLDVGCGTGGQLLRWIQWGAQPEHCHGVDLIEHRLAEARRRLPSAADLRTGDASRLPFPDATFDVISQFTVFSSILDPDMQQAVAQEMLRLTRPNGVILSYDFWLNPSNLATRGVTPARIRQLFPACRLDIQRITLAPPIARRLAPLSPRFCALLEDLRLFNSHFLIMIRPPSLK